MNPEVRDNGALVKKVFESRLYLSAVSVTFKASQLINDFMFLINR
jgi:hypothetical protein